MRAGVETGAVLPGGELAEGLVASDVRYFELGAQVESIAGARLAWMPGLADVPAGCVVLDADSWPDDVAAAAALEALERRVGEIGGRRVRLYLAHERAGVADALRERGYSSRGERGLVLPAAVPCGERVALDPLEDASGWRLKRELHVDSPDAADGHPVAPDRWVELERRKTGPAGLRPWLIRIGGTVAGTVCTLEGDGFLRLKNLLVRRDFRRRGVASATVAAFGAVARAQDRTLGLFAVEGTAGEGVYRKCGMMPVVRWVEWQGPPLDRAAGEGT